MMNVLKCDSKSCAKWGLLALRIAAGVIFIFHGYGKLFGTTPGMTGFTMMVTKLGFPLPVLFAYIAALAEFVGGIAILIGAWTRTAAALVGVNMLVAIILVKKFALPAIDPDLTLLAISIALITMGAGELSVSAMMKKPETKTT